jgi:4-amino-4-deoxy-L-arabinose transferase-like glycosyltransferase
MHPVPTFAESPFQVVKSTSQDTAAPRPSRGTIILLFAAATALRLWYAGVRQLVPDEAYYWLWSRHLAAGYLDHPPVIALLIRLGTWIAGQNEFGVRWIGALLAVATAGIMWDLTRRAYGEREAAWVAVVLLLSPMLNVVGTIITPDCPLLFCDAAALWFALRAIKEDGRWWLGFGIVAGTGLSSKYTMVLVGFSVAVALLGTGRGRRHFAQPWIWLAALIAFALFSPVIWWNQQHGWVSFLFQLNHGTTAKAAGESTIAHLNDLLTYVGGQLAVYTPVLFVMGLIVLWKGWRRIGHIGECERVLLLAATAPLVLFALSSLKRRPEPNWPLIAYLPLTILIVRDVLTSGSVGAGQWLRGGIIVAACATAFLHVPEALWAVAPQVRVKSLDEQFGWRELASRVESVKGNSPVFCDTYQIAAELTFYLPGQPQVWTLSVDRPTQLDYLAGRPDPSKLDRLVFVASGLTDASAPITGLSKFSKRELVSSAPHVLKHLVRTCGIVTAQR